MYKEKRRLTNEEMDNLSVIVDNSLDRLSELAHKYNIDENELINYFANIIIGCVVCVSDKHNESEE